jgi:hypothetical protein
MSAGTLGISHDAGLHENIGVKGDVAAYAPIDSLGHEVMLGVLEALVNRPGLRTQVRPLNIHKFQSPAFLLRSKAVGQPAPAAYPGKGLV